MAQAVRTAALVRRISGHSETCLTVCFVVQMSAFCAHFRELPDRVLSHRPDGVILESAATHISPPRTHDYYFTPFRRAPFRFWRSTRLVCTWLETLVSPGRGTDANADDMSLFSRGAPGLRERENSVVAECQDPTPVDSDDWSQKLTQPGHLGTPVKGRLTGLQPTCSSWGKMVCVCSESVVERCHMPD